MSGGAQQTHVGSTELNITPLFATRWRGAVTLALWAALIGTVVVAIVRPGIADLVLAPAAASIAWTTVLQYRNYRRLGASWPWGSVRS